MRLVIIDENKLTAGPDFPEQYIHHPALVLVRQFMQQKVANNRIVEAITKIHHICMAQPQVGVEP